MPYDKMSYPELQGVIQGKDIEARRTAAGLLQDEARQRIAAANTAAQDRADVGPFAQAVQSGMQERPAMTSGGFPGAQGPPAPGLSPFQAVLGAMSQYPGGARASGFEGGTALAALLRGAGGAGAGGGNQPLSLVPATSGTGEHLVTGAFAGQKFVPDAAYEKAIAEAKRAAGGTGSRAALPVLPKGGRMVKARDAEGDIIPGLYHIQDSKGNYVNSWHDSSPGAKANPFSAFLNKAGAGGGVSGGSYSKPADVNADYRAGKLSYDEAANILQDQFKIGVPATAAPDETTDETD